ncbi:MAG: hypothetical protein NVS3B10_14420 [Polyangiales bacterium]
MFCDGVEECLGGACVSARNAACRDRGGCATARCDEAAGACVVDVPTPSGCPTGEICAPGAGCTKPEGCKADAACDDGFACTDDHCELATGRCTHVPVDARCPDVGVCGRGVCAGSEAIDPSGCGGLPDASRCAQSEGCDLRGRCFALPVACVVDLDCADGSLCDGRERCEGGTCVHGARATCTAPDDCHQVVCKDRALGDPYCLVLPARKC